MVLFILTMFPHDLKGSEPTKFLKAKCFVDQKTKVCYLRTNDYKILINGSWTDKYIVSDTIMVEDELYLLLLEKEQ